MNENNSHLIAKKHSQKELFVCDIADAVLKDIMPQMEHPFYSLSKKPDTTIRRYEHKGNWMEVTPSVRGHATIYDKDILVYCISQIMAKLKRGEEVSQRVKMNSRDFLVFTNRGTGGKDYKALSESLGRLAGTQITTNILIGNDEEQQDFFSLIDAASLKRKHGLDGRLLWCEIKLSDWVFNAIKAKEVLTLHPDYFRLSKPIEKRIYEIARKHCGQQYSWKIDLKNLLKKTGSQSPLKRFKQLVKGLVTNNHLPDYAVNLEGELVTFTNKSYDAMNGWNNPTASGSSNFPTLNADTYELAKEAAPFYDIYFLEQEWLSFWCDSGKPKLRDADSAFVAFCRRRSEIKHNP